MPDNKPISVLVGPLEMYQCFRCGDFGIEERSQRFCQFYIPKGWSWIGLPHRHYQVIFCYSCSMTMHTFYEGPCYRGKVKVPSANYTLLNVANSATFRRPCPFCSEYNADSPHNPCPHCEGKGYTIFNRYSFEFSANLIGVKKEN